MITRSAEPGGGAWGPSCSRAPHLTPEGVRAALSFAADYLHEGWRRKRTLERGRTQPEVG